MTAARAQASLTALKEERMVENAQAMGEVMRANLVGCVPPPFSHTPAP